MVVRYGRTVEEGFLPVFSVNTAKEAEALLERACPRNADGEFVAEELVAEQTLENLSDFGERLARHYAEMTNGP